MTVNEEFVDVGLLVGQRNIFEDVSLGSGELWWLFFTKAWLFIDWKIHQSIVTLIGRLSIQKRTVSCSWPCVPSTQVSTRLRSWPLCVFPGDWIIKIFRDWEMWKNYNKSSQKTGEKVPRLGALKTLRQWSQDQPSHQEIKSFHSIFTLIQHMIYTWRSQNNS